MALVRPLLAGALAAVVIAHRTGCPLARAAVAVGILYLSGYVAGALLVRPTDDRTSLSLACIRLVAGLFVSAVAFLGSLELSLPWWVGPAALVAGALWRSGASALVPPRPTLAVTVGGVVAGVAMAALLAPPVVSAWAMAPGPFPPLFLNVDVAYFLEKVHALVRADSFPPESLGVLGGRRPYHFGLHGVAALVSRGSGVLPHHVMFAILVPLLAAGTVAAAVSLARALAPRVPWTLSAPLLVVAVPSLWYDFWLSIVPRLAEAGSSRSFGPIDALAGNWEMWGVTATLHNLAAHFLILAALAAWAQAPTLGWRLACVLVGSAMLFKSPTGVALMAGFCLSQAWRAMAHRSFRPLAPALGATAVFAVVYGSFWIALPIPAELHAVVDPFFQIDYVERHGGLGFFAVDVAWLLLPAAIAWRLGRAEKGGPGWPLLLFALAPFLVVNTLRLVDLRRDFGVSSMNEDDWRQIMLPVPVLLHAVVVGVVGHRWVGLDRLGRTACGVAVIAGLLPPIAVAVQYGRVLLDNPERGHEFADNRALGAALAVIPVSGSVIVTNDLRYPADGFRREDRQMQIPALFGHQAFAVNYFYESYPFSPARHQLQALLTRDTWTPDIEIAARENGWTHLVVHSAYVHPEPVPLERLFDNGTYAVYRFSGNQMP